MSICLMNVKNIFGFSWEINQQTHYLVFTLYLLTWLGISVNLNKGCLYISEKGISSLLETVEYITNNPYISTLAKLAGKIISTKFVY